LLINVYHGGQILNTSTSVGYDIRAVYTFSADETINLHDLKRQIADIIKNRLRENLEMTVKKVRGSVKQKFLIVQLSYNKLWRGRELAIANLLGSWERSYEMLLSLLAAI
jgi:hypothetical protein